MVYTLLFTLVFVALAILLLGVRVFFFKGKRFPNTHIGGNKAMKERGIVCAQTMDKLEREQQTPTTHRKQNTNNK